MSTDNSPPPTDAPGIEGEKPWFKKPLPVIALIAIVIIAIVGIVASLGDDTDLAIDEGEEEVDEAIDDMEDPLDEDVEEADGEEAAAEEDAADDGDAPTEVEVPEDGPTIVIRGQDFSEAITLAEVYGQYLEALGYPVEQLTPAGFRDEQIQGLETGEINLSIDYIGGALAALLPDAEPTDDADEIVELIAPEYEALGAVLLDYAEAQNGDAFVVRGDFPADTISEVDGSQVVFGASSQCFERPQCFIGLTSDDFYGLEFADTTTLEYGPLLGEALQANEVDAVIWEDTAAAIEEFGFKVLEDDLGLFPAQNIAAIVGQDVVDAYGDDLVDAINALTAMLTTEDLQGWNFQTDIEFSEPEDVATAWLEEMELI